MLTICVSEENFLFDFFNVFCHVDKNNCVEILFWWQRHLGFIHLRHRNACSGVKELITKTWNECFPE